MRQLEWGMLLTTALLVAACGGGGDGGGTATATTATADLSVNATVPAAVAVGQAFTATVSVSLPAGVTIAQDVTAAISSAPWISITSVRMSGAVCALGSKVSCRIPSMASGVMVMEIDATATAAGDLSITAEATSATFDPDTANNAQTKTTVAGLSTDSIQQAIDNAAPGQTIVVDPGTYVGTLTFGGKNVTLASRDGPANTKLIQPVGLSAVQMGTGGTLRGFTIVARSAGVQVDGLGGSVISDNVFDPSLWGTPTAVGVYGVNALSGATVQRNTFRNHSCPSPSVLGLESSGVVMFSSVGNPTSYGPIQISDNVFESNQCPDVGIGTLPSTSIAISNNNSSLPQPLGVLTGSANVTLSTINVSGTISWDTFSVGTGGNVTFAPPVQTSASGTVVLTSTSPPGSGISGVLTVQ